MRLRIGLLASRDFRLLWTGETASFLGTGISELALPLVALDVLHAGAFAVSALTAMAWLPWLVIGLPAGAWVDRLPRRNIMIAADLLSLGAFLSVPVAAWFGVLTVAQLVIVALAGGVASVFFKTAYRAFLPALLKREDLLEANAKLSGSEQVTAVAGPGAAGLLAQIAGAVAGVLANAVSFAVSALCLSLLHVREPKLAEVRQRHLLREIGEGLQLVARDPLLRANTLYGCLSNLVLAGYQAVLVVFLVKTVGLSSGVTGIMIALPGRGIRRPGGALGRDDFRQRPRRVLRQAAAHPCRAADPAHYPRGRADAVRSGQRADRCCPHRGQHHLGQLGAGLLPSADARPGFHQHLGVRLRSGPRRGSGRRADREPRRGTRRSMGHARRPGAQLACAAGRPAPATARPAESQHTRQPARGQRE
jgi:MFS family permease